MALEMTLGLGSGPVNRSVVCVGPGRRWYGGSGAINPLLLRVGLLALALGLVPIGARAQSATLRGFVVDEQGKPIPAVKVDLEFKGESRQKIVKALSSDKKGGFIHVGLPPGPWSLTFTKEGFKPHRMETDLSAGGVSELPPITLHPAPAAGANPASPADAQAAAREAEQIKQLGDSKKAVEDYTKAVEALKGGRDAEAEALFKQVLAVAPNLAEAHYNIGYLATRKGDLVAAEAEFRKTIELQPQHGEAHVALAALLGKNGKGEEALKVLQDASERFSQDVRFQFALGAAAFNLARNAEAEAAFGKVLELDPANAESRFFLGSLAISRNDVPAALVHLEKFLTVAAPGSPDIEAAKGLIKALKARK